jgi:hypothetical protein
MQVLGAGVALEPAMVNPPSPVGVNAKAAWVVARWN